MGRLRAQFGSPARLAALVLAALALAVRVIHLRAGLPGAAMRSPDEHTVVPKALHMLTSGDLNPHWFLYPSAYLMAVAGVVGVARPWIDHPPGLDAAGTAAYAADPSAYILTGRVLSVLAGVGLVVATILLGRRVGGRLCALAAGALVAISPLAVDSSQLAVTDMAMAAVATLGLWRLVLAVEGGRRRDLVVAAALLGLATSLKYSAGVWVVVALAAGWAAGGGRRIARLRRMGLAGAVASGAFVLGTPYALLDAPTFVGDFIRQSAIQRDGWLGFEATRPGVVANVAPNLTTALGVVALVLVLVGIVVGLRRRGAADWILWPATIATYLLISTWHANFDRYLLPILPTLAIAAGLGAQVLAGRLRDARLRRVVMGGLAIALLGQPAVGLARHVERTGRPEQRLTALPKIEATIPADAAVAADPLTPPLLDAATAQALRRAGGIRPGYRLTTFRTPQPGRPADPLRAIAALRTRGIAWVLTSDDIERRARAAGPGRYPSEVAFYDGLRAEATPVFTIAPGLGPGARLWYLAKRPSNGPDR